MKERLKGLIRVRSRDYRIDYRIIDDCLIVTVVRVGDHQDVYDD